MVELLRLYRGMYSPDSLLILQWYDSRYYDCCCRSSCACRFAARYGQQNKGMKRNKHRPPAALGEGVNCKKRRQDRELHDHVNTLQTMQLLRAISSRLKFC